MRKYEFIFNSVNSETYPKPITVLVMEPDNIDKNTGAMLFTHGWGGNRFQHQDKMKYTVDKYSLVCISAEYRQSGFDFDPIKGLGAYLPYDASFYQVFDVLNAFREAIKFYPEIERKRFYHYGGSQGGHIALLSSIFAPNTFAFVYASSALVELDKEIRKWTGRDFQGYELDIRNVLSHADMIKCPLILEHGTADVTVSCKHATKLETKLSDLKKEFNMCYYEDGGHDLMPAISKFDSFTKRADTHMKNSLNSRTDDFLAENKINIDCGTKKLSIDWSQKSDSINLFKWINN